jgi:nucleotide-binding universal stress UspA family protein
VISVPNSAQFSEIRQLLVCTDLSMPLSDHQCEELKYLGEHMKAQFVFLHVQDKVEIALPEDSLSVATIQKNFGVTPVTIPFEKSIATSVNKFLKENGGEMAVTLPHHHTWLDNLFLGSETAAMSDELSIPLLSLGGMKK